MLHLYAMKHFFYSLINTSKHLTWSICYIKNKNFIFRLFEASNLIEIIYCYQLKATQQ